MRSFYFSLLFIISFVTSFSQVPSNDNPCNATSLGTLPAPPACATGVTIANGNPITLNNQSTVGATGANPYTYLTGCQGGGPQQAPALDTWYSFVASGSIGNIVISGFPNASVALWSGTCNNLAGVACMNLPTAGTGTLTTQQLVVGQTYWIEISGGTATATDNSFSISVDNDNDCNNCLGTATLTANPQPVNGGYTAGQVVQFCFTVNSYTEVNTNWFHGVQISMGSGWTGVISNPIPSPECTFDPTAGPGNAGAGQWAFYNSVTSSATGQTFGPGFYFDNSNVAGTNPGQNFGDPTNGNCTWTFCWSLTVGPCTPGMNLNVTVNTTGDGESGSWSNPGCAGDFPTNFSAVGVCCIPPAMTSVNTATVCSGGTVSIPFSSNPVATSYSWIAGNNANVNGESTTAQSTSTLSNTLTNTTTSVQTVVYTVTPSGACVGVPQTVTVTVNPTPTVAVASQTVCAGATVNASAFVSAPVGGTFAWSNSNTSIGLGASGVGNTPSFTATNATGAPISGIITVTPTVNGCAGTPNSYTITVNPLPVTTASNTGSYCPGQTISLSATGGGTYLWSGPGAYTSTLQNPTRPTATTAMSGLYTLTVTLNGCTATASTSVTVNPTPVVTASNTGAYCPGQTISLASGGGGTYAWSGPNSFTSTNQNPNIPSATTAMGGIYSVTVTVNGCTAAASTTVTVNPTPTITASNTGPYCSGQTISLSSTGGGTYSWSGPNLFTSTSQNPTITSSTTAMSGIYSVTVSLSGCTASATTSVTVNPTPTVTATNAGAYCPGQTISLTSSGGGTYAWVGPNSFASTIQNPTIPSATTAMAGNYSVTVTLNSCTTVATTSVTVNPTPIISASNAGPYCVGQTINLSSSGGGTYSWTGPNSFTSTSQNPTIPNSTTAMGGVYSLTVTLNSCTASLTTSVIINPLPVITATNNGPYCEGSTISLVGTGGGTYSWAGPSSFTSSSPSPSIPSSTTSMGGIYSLTVSLNGCTATATSSVTVNAVPNPTSNNTGPYCPGQTISLTSSGGGTYSWGGPNSFTSSSQNPNLSGATTAMSGPYTVTVTLNGCTSTATTTVTVNPNPTITATNTGPYCPGITAQLNATGGGTYSWSGPNSFTSTSQSPSLGTASSIISGIYTLTVTLNSCTSTASTTVVVNSSITPGLSSNSPACVGNALNLYCANGVSWSWSGPNSFTSTQQNPIITPVTSAAAGTYSATVTDATGCSGTATISIVVNPIPTPLSNNSGPYCPGNIISLSATGGGTYAWSGPNSFSSTNQNPTLLNATTAMSGIYTVTVTLNGCTATTTTSVTVNPTPTVTAANTGPYCPGSTINLSSTGGGTYSWTGPNGFTSTNQNPTIINATSVTGGVYSVTASVNGCTASATTNVSINAAITASLTTNSPVCEGNSLNLSAVNGVGWSWTGPNGFTSSQQNPSISSVSSIASGVYTATVTDASGCVGTGTISVIINPLPTPVATNLGPFCVGSTISLGATGGGAYSWSGPNSFISTNQNPAIPGATTAMGGNYSVTVTLNGCTAIATTSVIVNPNPVTTASNTGPYCPGATINLSSTGGGTYSWIGPNSFTSTNQNPTINSTTSSNGGIYSVTVTLNGCTTTATTNVIINPSLVPQISSNSPVCEGSTLNLSSSNGALWSWSGPNGFSSNVQNPSINAITLAGSGTYSATVTDALGCSGTGTISVVVNPLPIPSVTNTGPYCPGDNIFLTATGGGTYSWSGPNSFTSVSSNPGITNATISMGGVYGVTVTANNCTATATTTVTVNSLPVVVANNSGPYCPGATISLSSSGGTSYSWTGPNTFTSTNQNPTVSSAGLNTIGVYTVVATANNCTASATTTVTLNAIPIITATSDTICVGFSANISASGATSYTWSSGVTTTNPNGSTATASPTTTTTYTVTGTDANGCTSTGTSVVTVNTSILVDAGLADTVCVGNSFTLNATGPAGTTFIWTDGTSNFLGTSQTFTATSTQTYTVNGVDPLGCTGSDVVVITVPPIFTLNAGGFATTCNGVCDGQVVVLATPSSGTFSNYTYQWSNGSQQPSVNNLCPGNFTVTVANSAGCTVTATATVTQPTAVTAVSSGNTAASCNGSCDGSVTITAAGGAGNYSFTWTPSGSGSNPTNLCAGNYTCTVSDANNCTAQTTVVISQPAPITASITPVATICIGQTANLNSTPSGGNGGYVFSWSGGTSPNNLAGVSASPTVTTTYTVSITDLLGCPSATAIVNVPVNPPLSINASNNVVLCGGQTANMSALANGGDGNYSYSWATGTTPNTGQNVAASPTVTTIYTVTVNDGCGTPSAIDNVTITVSPAPTLSVSVDDNGGCAPLCVTFTAISNPASVSCNWTFSDGQTSLANCSPNICFNTAGSYGATLNVTDINGCTNSITNNNLVNVYPIPEADFGWGPQPLTDLNPVVQFSDQSTGGTIVNWFWQFGDPQDNSSTAQNPTFDYAVSGQFLATLTVINSNGCIDSTSQLITIAPEFSIYVPNAFTPGGDDGTGLDAINDDFFAKGVGVDPDNFEMWIFDRWGNNIFYTKDFNEHWNGKVMGGKSNAIVQQDVYVWKINLKTLTGEKKSFIGHVTVIK